MNSRLGFDFLTFAFKENQADNEDSNDADGVVHSPTHKRKRIYREWQKLLVAKCEDDKKVDLESCTSVSDKESDWAWLDSFDDTTDDSSSEFEL